MLAVLLQPWSLLVLLPVLLQVALVQLRVMLLPLLLLAGVLLPAVLLLPLPQLAVAVLAAADPAQLLSGKALQGDSMPREQVLRPPSSALLAFAEQLLELQQALEAVAASLQQWQQRLLGLLQALVAAACLQE